MTAQELINHFNTHSEIYEGRIYEVDAETFANVFKWIVEKKIESGNEYEFGFIHLAIGINGGLKFKGIELIYAPMAEQADASDLKSEAPNERIGSNPIGGTNFSGIQCPKCFTFDTHVMRIEEVDLYYCIKCHWNWKG